MFDIGGTLLNPVRYDRRAGIEAIAEFADRDTPIPVDRAIQLGEALDADLEAACRATGLEYRQADFLRLLYDRLGVRFSIDFDELARRTWEAAISFEPEPGVHDALAAASRHGVDVAVVSNAVCSAEILVAELARHGIGDSISLVVSSADYGVRKPRPDIFWACLGRLGVPPEEAWYVGNIFDIDVRGARAAGMVPVWYNRVPHGFPPPHSCLVVRSWAEFTDLLGRKS